VVYGASHMCEGSNVALTPSTSLSAVRTSAAPPAMTLTDSGAAATPVKVTSRPRQGQTWGEDCAVGAYGLEAV
jgi:hypothetical protein